MFLKKCTYSNGRTFLSIVESYRDDNGKSKQRTIKKVGYLDELAKQFDDPIDYFSKLAKSMSIVVKDNSSIDLNIDLSSPIDSSYNLFNVGYVALKSIYNELMINEFLKNKQRKLNIDYSLNKNLELQVFSRILYPASKKSTYENRKNFFEPFDDGITKDSIYRCLDYFYKYKSDIQRIIWENTRNSYDRSCSTSYYDCTNYYFEIEYNDDDVIDDSGNIKEKGLRKRGPEKNRRPDPIIEMGLLMDSTNIPMAYDIFPGNESEKLSLRPLLKKTKANFGIDRIIVVADRGLNTSDNIYFLAGKNENKNHHMDGYVYGQSVRGGDKEFKAWVLDESGYVTDVIKDGDNEIAFTHKSRVHSKQIKIKREGTRKVSVNVCQKQMVYFSFKYLMKQRNDRNRMIEKAKDLIANPSKYTKATSYGAAGYINNIAFNRTTGEVKTDRELSIDWEGIKEEERFDGYYSIVTSEIEYSDIKIRNIYRGLAKIEETFKVTKSILESRPAYVWTKEHIEGHFLVCFVALVIVRLLEKKLGNEITVERIIESLKKYNCTNIGTNIYQFIYRDEVIDKISKEIGLDLNKKYRKREEIKKMIKY